MKPAPPHNPVEAAPRRRPQWLAPFRLRYTLHVGGVRTKSTAKSIIAQLPTGGRLRPDAADVAVQTADGERLPVDRAVARSEGNDAHSVPAPRRRCVVLRLRRRAGDAIGRRCRRRPTSKPLQEGLTSRFVVGPATISAIGRSCARPDVERERHRQRGRRRGDRELQSGAAERSAELRLVVSRLS